MINAIRFTEFLIDGYYPVMTSVNNSALAYAHCVVFTVCVVFSISWINLQQMMKSENKLVHVVVWCLPRHRNTSQCLKILFWSFNLRKNICNFSFFARYIIHSHFYIWQGCKRLKHLGSVFVLLKTVLIVRSYVMLCEHSQELVRVHTTGTVYISLLKTDLSQTFQFCNLTF